MGADYTPFFSALCEMPLRLRPAALIVRSRIETKNLGGLGFEADMEGAMSSITLIDVMVVTLIYAGLSLICALASRLLSVFRRDGRYVTRQPWRITQP